MYYLVEISKKPVLTDKNSQDQYSYHIYKSERNLRQRLSKATLQAVESGINTKKNILDKVNSL
jgi:hypothetical protein